MCTDIYDGPRRMAMVLTHPVKYFDVDLTFPPRAQPLISVALSEMTRLTDLLPRNMTQAFMSATR